MMTDLLRAEIIEKVAEINPEVFIVELALRSGKQNSLILRVDTDKGINMQECSSLSRQLGAWLEAQETFDFSYHLEVSSPGVGTPLVMHRQYVQNIGRNLRVMRQDGQQEEGTLEAVDEEGIVLAPVKIKKGKKKPKAPEAVGKEEPAIRKIRFEEIKEAKVIITI